MTVLAVAGISARVLAEAAAEDAKSIAEPFARGGRMKQRRVCPLQNCYDMVEAIRVQHLFVPV